MKKSSWHFILTIDKHNNITTDEEQIDREKHITICRCGKKRVEIVLFKPNDKKKYESVECKDCGNEDFIFCTGAFKIPCQINSDRSNPITPKLKF